MRQFTLLVSVFFSLFAIADSNHEFFSGPNSKVKRGGAPLPLAAVVTTEATADRIIRFQATVSSRSSCTVGSGAGISGGTWNSDGDCTYQLSTETAAPPICTCSGMNAVFCSVSSASNSELRIVAYSSNSNTAPDATYNVICVGKL